MTPEQFIARINAAETYEDAHQIALEFQPIFAKLTNVEKGKWRVKWKARKAALQALDLAPPQNDA